MNTETCPDYEIAREELAALWQNLNLKASITGAHAAMDESNWEHVAMTVTISRPARPSSQSGRSLPEAAESFSWRMGLGLADWAAIAKLPSVRCDPINARNVQLMQRGQLKGVAASSLATQHLGAFVKAVNPAEVLARACEDARSTETSFEDWASEYGYDTDSRKAEAVYFACQAAGTKARKLVDRATFEKLAELACRL